MAADEIRAEAIRADRRGVAVALQNPLLAPPSIMHYEPGPLTYRQFTDDDGKRWLAIYEAEFDGLGWKVVRATCRALVFLPGDAIHIRAIVEETHGDLMLLKFADDRGSQSFWLSSSEIVFIEEKPAGAIP